MTGAHIHLLLNHFPIVGGVIGLLVLVYAWLRRNDAVFRVGLGLFVLLAVLTVLTYLSGEPAEHVLEAQPNFSEALVEPHEEAALFALIVYGAMGLVSLFALVRYARTAVPRGLAAVVLGLSLLSVGVASYVGWLGGPISHEEVRSGTQLNSPGVEAEDDD